MTKVTSHILISNTMMIGMKIEDYNELVRRLHAFDKVYDFCKSYNYDLDPKQIVKMMEEEIE